MSLRYVMEGVALDVFEAPSGWFVQFTPQASLFLGRDKPDIARGDRVRISVEKLRPAETAPAPASPSPPPAAPGAAVAVPQAEAIHAVP